MDSSSMAGGIPQERCGRLAHRSRGSCLDTLTAAFGARASVFASIALTLATDEKRSPGKAPPPGPAFWNVPWSTGPADLTRARDCERTLGHAVRDQGGAGEPDRPTGQGGAEAHRSIAGRPGEGRALGTHGAGDPRGMGRGLQPPR